MRLLRLHLQKIITREGWNLSTDNGIKTSNIQIINGSYKINIHRESFVSVLQSSDVLKAQAGTADAFDCWVSMVDSIST